MQSGKINRGRRKKKKEVSLVQYTTVLLSKNSETMTINILIAPQVHITVMTCIHTFIRIKWYSIVSWEAIGFFFVDVLL